MKLSTLKFYIEKEKEPIQRIFINCDDWDDLIKELEDPIIHIRNWVEINNISVHKNVHQLINWATFVICDGDIKENSSYRHYGIEILTEEEKIIKSIIE